MSKNNPLTKVRRIIRNWQYLDADLLKKLPSLKPSDLEFRHYTKPALNGSKKRAEIVLACHNANPFEVCVETGSWLGATTDFLAGLHGAPAVHSAELNPAFHDFATMRTRHCPNVTCHLSSSEKLLTQLDPEVKDQRSFVYLDAHWNDYLPLRDELDICGHWSRAVIMIDDFEVEGDPSFKFDDYGPEVGTLTLSFIADQVADHAVYFPAFTAAEDEGSKSGFVIITKDPAAIQTLDASPHLRRHNV